LPSPNSKFPKQKITTFKGSAFRQKKGFKVVKLQTLATKLTNTDKKKKTGKIFPLLSTLSFITYLVIFVKKIFYFKNIPSYHYPSFPLPLLYPLNIICQGIKCQFELKNNNENPFLV